MSQDTRTVLRSCGLMVGLNMAPPPPGPKTLKFPGRSAKAAPASKAKRITCWLTFAIRFFLLLSISLGHHFPAKPLKCQSQKNSSGFLKRHITPAAYPRFPVRRPDISAAAVHAIAVIGEKACAALPDTNMRQRSNYLSAHSRARVQWWRETMS